MTDSTNGYELHDPDIIGSQDADAITIGRYRDWITGEVGPRLCFGGDQGVMLLGANGVGKDTRVIINNLLKEPGVCSHYVLDPKGEICAVTALYRRTVSEVVIINPDGELVGIPGYEDLKSDGLNPLLTLDPDSPDFLTEVGYVADALIMAEKGDSGNAKFFIESANALLTLAIMWEVITARRENRVPTFAKVRELICTPTGHDPVLKQDYGWPELAAEMIRYGNPAISNLASQFVNYNNEVSGVLADAKRQTRALDEISIATDLAKGTFDLRELKKRPVTVYVIMNPLRMQRHARFLRMHVSSALRAVMRPREDGEPSKVVFWLNEMRSLGRLDILSQVWSVVRGFGIQIISVLQSLSQLDATYGREDADTFVEQAGVIASFGAANLRTAEWLSKRCGDTTTVLAGFNQGNSQNGGGAGTSSGLNYAQVKVPAVTPHEMFNLRNGSMVMFAAGLADFINAYAPPYYWIDECTDRARANPYYRPKGGA